jgi:hypothetical protein
MRHQLRKWLLSLIPILSLACAEATAPQPEPEVKSSCIEGRCMTCYIYATEVVCVKD